jgi:hypothetical protein
MSETAGIEHPGLSLHAKDQCAAGLAHATQLLHEEFDSVLGGHEVDACIAEVTATFADATVLSFVPLLVRRYARDELVRRAAAVEAHGHRADTHLMANVP